MIISDNKPSFLQIYTVVSYGTGLSQKMASACERELLRTQKCPKKDLIMNYFTHAQKIDKR